MYFQLLLSLVSASFILTPKENHLNANTVNFESFSNEHKLDKIATFDEFSVYKTSTDNFELYKNTITELFDVEKDLTITLPKPIESTPQVIFTQMPGETEFSIGVVVPWHLEKIARNNTFCHTNPNITIHTYVVDTGIDVNHPEFEGRATWLANFADDTDTDCNNHGTHCSGLVGSKTYGVCKDAQLFAIKVLNCKGSGSYSGILAGLDYVYNRHLQQSESDSGIRSIVSMSLGGGFSKAINRAVEHLIKSDTMYVTVASGNEDSDACRTSPASAKGIFTVNAMDRYDNRAYFSNYGKCTDIYAPGVDIISTIPNGKTAVYSGTSMAGPVLGGVLNHYIDMYPDMNMKEIKHKIMSDATKNVIRGNPKNTNNLLVNLVRKS